MKLSSLFLNYSIILNLLHQYCIGYELQIIKIVNDIIKNENVPTQLIISSCWNFEYNKLMISSLMIPIQFIENYNVTFEMNDDRNKLLFLVDLNCPFESEKLKKTNNRLFSTPYRWIIFENMNLIENKTNNMDFIQDIQALPDSNIILVTRKTDLNYELQQFYRVEKDSSIIYEKFGIWSELNGLIDLRTTRILSRRRKNLYGKVLTASVVILNNDSMNHLTDYRDRHLDAISKVNYVLLCHLIDTLNGTRNFKFVNSWGYLNTTTNEWNGMIGDLLKKNADIGGTALFITPDRVGLIDYVAMTSPTRTNFVFRAPPLSYVANIYFLPFNGLVWICSGAFILLCIIIIFITLKLQNYNDKQNDNFRPQESTKFSDVVLLAIGAICQMGPQYEPRISSARLSTLFLFIAVLFLYTSYSANIVALLQSTTKSITTLEDLLNSQLEFGVDDTVYNRYYFSTATEPIRKAIYETKIIPPKKPNRFMNITYGVSRLRKGFFTFYMESGTGYKIIEETFYEHEKCGLIEIPFIQVVDPWLSIQKYSPYKEMIKVNLFKLREHGLQGSEMKRVYTKRPICDSQGKNFGSVGLTDCFVALIILAYGFLLSFILFIFEKILFIKKSQICLY